MKEIRWDENAISDASARLSLMARSLEQSLEDLARLKCQLDRLGQGSKRLARLGEHTKCIAARIDNARIAYLRLAKACRRINEFFFETEMRNLRRFQAPTKWIPRMPGKWWGRMYSPSHKGTHPAWNIPYSHGVVHITVMPLHRSSHQMLPPPMWLFDMMNNDV